MLETIREFALEQLVASGEAGEIGRRHMWHFLAVAEESELVSLGAVAPPGGDSTGRLSAVRRAWLVRLDADRENLRAAFEWSRRTGDGETAARLAGALFQYWYLHGRMAEARRSLAMSLSDGGGPPGARAKALTAAGYAAWVQGDFAIALEYHSAGVNLWRGLGDAGRLSNALSGLALTLLARGDLAAARAAVDECERLDRCEVGEPMHAFALMARGFVTGAQRDDGVADAAFRESVALYQGAPDEAEARFRESLLLYKRVGDRLSLPLVVHHLGDVARRRAQYERAARLFGAAQALWEAAGLTGVTSPWSLYERPDLEAEIAAVCGQVGEPAFARAWAAGHALTLDEAIGEALHVGQSDLGRTTRRDQDAPPDPGWSSAGQAAP
jgi:tetratricopeptide (TPR) repeat protein